MRIEYTENNSGGSWWLDESHYKALELSGWIVKWDTPETSVVGRIAQSAILETTSVKQAIRSWEEATGMDADDPGCECCGRPHNFYEVQD